MELEGETCDDFVVDFDGQHAGGPLRQLSGQDASSGAYLHHHIAGRDVGGLDYAAEDAPVNEEILAQRFFRD